MSKRGNYWRTNESIRSPEVRVIGADGKQLGIMPTSEAITKAKEANLDLIEVASNAKPPVARIMDFGKFKYKEERKLRKQKKKNSEVKEVRFSPFIADGDYNVRIEKIRDFLGDSNKVRVVVVFKGRQLGSKQFGYKLLERVLDEFRDRVVIDMEPKFLGRHLAMVISPLKKKILKNKDAKTENKKISSKEV